MANENPRVARGKMLDAVSDSALSWAAAASDHLTASRASLETALQGLTFERRYPAPEWRQAQRLIFAADKLLKESL